MNLEDRLRSHLHSSQDGFATSDRDVGAIASAGRRRTRRNQVGGAAGGLLALAIVFGMASSFGGGGDEDVFARAETDSAVTDDAVTEMAESAIAPANDGQGGGLDDAAQSAAAPDGFVPTYEVITGVGDGFAGLRSSASGIEFIESDDGELWSVRPTTGIPEGAEITSITADDGVFAAPFHVFDPATDGSTAYVGTSDDGESWSVSPFELGDDLTDAFLPEVVLSSGDVVGVVIAWPLFDEASDESGDASVFVVRGPVGGPFEPTLLPTTGFGIGELASTDSVVMFNLFHDGGSRIWASTNAGEWTVVREFGVEGFASLGDGGSQVVLAGAAAIEVSVDEGATWTTPDLQTRLVENNSSVVLVSGPETAAILISRVSPDAELDGHQLLALIDDEWREVSLDRFVPDSAFVSLVAVSDEAALLEIFPVIDDPAEDLAASGGLVEVPGPTDDHDHDHDLDFEPAPPSYVRVPLY